MGGSAAGAATSKMPGGRVGLVPEVLKADKLPGVLACELKVGKWPSPRSGFICCCSCWRTLESGPRWGLANTVGIAVIAVEGCCCCCCSSTEGPPGPRDSAASDRAMAFSTTSSAAARISASTLRPLLLLLPRLRLAAAASSSSSSLSCSPSKLAPERPDPLLLSLSSSRVARRARPSSSSPSRSFAASTLPVMRKLSGMPALWALRLLDLTSCGSSARTGSPCSRSRKLPMLSRRLASFASFGGTGRSASLPAKESASEPPPSSSTVGGGVDQLRIVDQSLSGQNLNSEAVICMLCVLCRRKE
eukprot:1159177-Pelagomonas_calceolata.AAC.4